MKRNKKIVLVAHCILNCNSKVEGLSLFEGVQKDVLKYLIEKDYGIIQLPCPEIDMYGIKRWGHVKEQFDTPYYRENCRRIFRNIKSQIIDYIKNGYEIKAIIGIEGSPSCGVNYTCSSKYWGGEVGEEFNIINKLKTVKMVEGMGVFFEEIRRELNDIGLDIKFVGIDETKMKQSLIDLDI